jgi:hypothetical protein
LSEPEAGVEKSDVRRPEVGELQRDVRRRALLLAALTLIACDDEAARRRVPPSKPASPSAVARALGLDAASLASPVDPPPPAGDLAREVAEFTSLEACVEAHAKTDPLVGDALQAIGYDTFLRDACRVLQAMKSKTKDACAAIDAQGLRARCEGSVAMQNGAPDDCPPEIPDTPGRDARCVAAASRNPRLCGGVGPSADARKACEALVTREEKRCGPDAACAREVARWKNVLPAPENSGAPYTSRASIEARGAEGTADPPSPMTDLAADFMRGVVVSLDFAGAHVALGSRREIGATTFAPAPTGRTRLALDVLVPSEKPAELEHAEVSVPGSATFVLPGARFDGRVLVTKLEPKRGGEMNVTLEGTVGAAPRAYRIKAEIATFVRDVVKSPTAGVRKPLAPRL